MVNRNPGEASFRVRWLRVMALWLEHVSAADDPNGQYYWLMWYGPDGWPTISMSGILNRAHIANMQRLFASFIP